VDVSWRRRDPSSGVHSCCSRGHYDDVSLRRALQGWIQQAHPTRTLDRQDPSLTFLPPSVVQQELTEKLDAAVESIGVKLEWEDGDLAFNDNLAMAHLASSGTQGGRSGVGLRVLDRTTVAGETRPSRTRDDVFARSLAC
jgi:hypothetical protein